MLEPLLRGTPKSTPLSPAPITPEWIEAGDPIARSAVLSRSDDRAAMVVHWDCTAGKFTWRYRYDETIVILEGGCKLEADGLPTMELGPGDSAHFSRGAVVTWTIDHYVRKLGFFKVAPPRPIALMLRLIRALWRRVSGEQKTGALIGGGEPGSAPAA